MTLNQTLSGSALLLGTLLTMSRIIFALPTQGESVMIAFFLSAWTVLGSKSPVSHSGFKLTTSLMAATIIALWIWVRAGEFFVLTHPDDQEDWTAILSLQIILLTTGPYLIPESDKHE